MEFFRRAVQMTQKRNGVDGCKRVGRSFMVNLFVCCFFCVICAFLRLKFQGPKTLCDSLRTLCPLCNLPWSDWCESSDLPLTPYTLNPACVYRPALPFFTGSSAALKRLSTSAQIFFSIASSFAVPSTTKNRSGRPFARSR